MKSHQISIKEKSTGHAPTNTYLRPSLVHTVLHEFQQGEPQHHECRHDDESQKIKNTSMSSASRKKPDM